MKTGYGNKRGKFDSNQQQCIGPNKRPSLPSGAQLPILQCMHELANWGKRKMVSWGKNNILGNLLPQWLYVCNHRSVCPKYNPGETLHWSQGNFPLRPGSSEIRQMDFTQMPPSQEHECVLVLICMFLHWVKAFPCRTTTAQAVGQILLEKNNSHMGEVGYPVTEGLISQDK